MPKPNLYQSLHTTVVGERGQPFEVQIRTREMDLIAEEGIAAHWRYKEGKLDRSADDDHNIVWLRQLLEWQKEVAGPAHLPHHAQDRPLPGRGLRLHAQGRGASPSRAAPRRSTSPTGSTPTSATTAPARGSTAGWCRCARRSRTATSSRSSPTRARSPSRDWLNFVATSRAKSKIRHWLNTAAEAARHRDRPPAAREGAAQATA